MGFAVYGGSTAGLSVWYDDLALSRSRIGCPRAALDATSISKLVSRKQNPAKSWS
jgi:hypothetical protein